MISQPYPHYATGCCLILQSVFVPHLHSLCYTSGDCHLARLFWLACFPHLQPGKQLAPAWLASYLEHNNSQTLRFMFLGSTCLSNHYRPRYKSRYSATSEANISRLHVGSAVLSEITLSLHYFDASLRQLDT